MIKKLFLAIFCLVLVVALSIPYVTGIEVERQLAQFNQNLGHLANLQLIDSTIQRGWFSSTAQATFKLLNANSSEQRLIVTHVIDHGLQPLRLTMIHTTITPDKSFNVESLQIVGTTPLQAETAIKINGEGISTLTMATGLLTHTENQLQIQWQELQGLIYFTPNLSSFRANIHIPNLQVTHQQGQVIAQEVDLYTNLQPDNTHLFKGEGSLTIATVDWMNKSAMTTQLTGLRILGQSTIVNANLAITTQTDVQQILIGTERYGAGFMDAELRQLHVQTLNDLKTTLATHPRGFSPQSLDMLTLSTLLQQGMTLINNAPEFNITQLRINTPDGELQGTLRLKLERFDPRVFLNPLMWLETMTAQLNLRMPHATLYDIVKQFAGTTLSLSEIEQLIKQGLTQHWLIPDAAANYYRTQLTLQQGILTINGHSQPVNMLKEKGMLTIH